MITIKTIDENNAEIKIKKGTPYTTMLLGTEMLIEAILEEKKNELTIDILLEDLKRIYERDNGNDKKNNNV